MKLFSLSLLILFTSVDLNAQPCSCETSFMWMKKTFEENDAGFSYILSKKGADAYELHTRGYLEKAKTATNNKECAVILDKWLRFFRQGHIGIDFKEKDTPSTQGSIVPDKWEKLKIPVSEFKKYLDNKKDPGYEGIWLAEPYKIGIKKIDNQYVGFIIETTAEGWMKDDLKTKFDDNGGIYYLRNKTGERFKKVLLEGKNDLQLGNFSLKRVYPVLQNDAATELNVKLLKSSTPFLEQLNSQTLILRIPSFEIAEKKHIDSVIKTNKALILSTPNLIIDVRNNGGGSDASFKEILPFLYTNPVRTVGVQFLSTPLNNQRMLDLSNNPEFDSSSRKKFKAYYDTLQQSPGKFVNLSRELVGIEERDTVYTYPRSVGILINEKNGSTTEQFLLAAKQSQKVKLFGVTTFGMLDISNVHIIPFPCGPFELYYGLSKSYRIPGMAIDDIGLQPDYYIDPTVKSAEWIHFGDRVLRKK